MGVLGSGDHIKDLYHLMLVLFVCVRAYSGALYYYLYMYNIITIARVLT